MYNWYKWFFIYYTNLDELKKGGSLVYGADEGDEEGGPG